jgi:hypothetical protein
MDTELRRMELEAQLDAQNHSKKVALLEVYKMTKRIEQMKVTAESLDTAILKTMQELEDVNAEA